MSRRIAVLVDHFPELSETFVAAEVHALQARGARVHVEAAERAPHPHPAGARGLDVRYAGEDSVTVQLAALAWLWGRAPRACLRDLADRRRWRRQEWAKPLRAIAPTARRIHRRADEHLHAHFGAGAALDALRIGRLLGLPFSVTFHGYDIFRTPRNLPEKIDRAAFATSGSEFTVAHLRALRPGARVHKVVMGVDPERWRRTAPPASGGTILAVGRLVEKKGFAHLLRAAARLRDTPGFGGSSSSATGRSATSCSHSTAGSGSGHPCASPGHSPPSASRGCSRMRRWSRSRASWRPTATRTRCP